MSRWRLETSADFDRSARKLDKPVLKRIRRYLDEVIELENPRDRGKALSADRTGYWRYRIDDHRVIVEIIDDRLLLVALGVGHRAEVYRG